MKLTKTTSGTKVSLTKAEWLEMGKKFAQLEPPSVAVPQSSPMPPSNSGSPHESMLSEVRQELAGLLKKIDSLIPRPGDTDL